MAQTAGYTTNFDNLIEEACRRSNVECEVVRTPGGLAIADHSKLGIFKLHGDFEHPESIVITAEDFDDYFRSHAALARKVASDLSESTVLFLGYSFSDPDIKTIMREVRRQSDGFPKKHFIVQIDPPRAVLKELERRGLDVIELEQVSSQSDTVRNWLSSLDRQIRERIPSPTSVTHNLPPFITNLVGRQTDLITARQSLITHRVLGLVGSPGIGKTSLALEVGRGFAHGTPSLLFRYIVWLTAREGLQQKNWFDDMLNNIGTTLGYPVIAQKPQEQVAEKRVQVKLLLETHATLLVLDNFDAMLGTGSEYSAFMQWLGELPAASHVLFTSRIDPKISVAHLQRLDRLSVESAVELLRIYASDSGTRGSFIDNPAALRKITEYTDRNPQAMKLTVGVIQGGAINVDQVISELESLKGNVDRVFDLLFSWSWDSVSEGATRILQLTPLFAGLGLIWREALSAAVGLSRDVFDKSLSEVLSFGLLDAASENRLVAHPKTLAFAVSKMRESSKLERDARERVARFYLEYIRETIVRKNPAVRYWNVLVSDKMKDIDREWPAIRDLVAWAAKQSNQELLVDFVMLLVHYLDSRFLNKDRLDYLRLAADYLHGTDRIADEALLRIDALGWTYVEDCRWPEAHQQIAMGSELAKRVKTAEGADLGALGNAWKARALIEEGKADDAELSIKEAVENINSISPWIRVRINMAAGDIELKQRRDSKALEYFEAASAAAKEYGGEGGGYQLEPRIGLALLNLGRHQEAADRFQLVRNLQGIPIGKLYGEYGLALIAYKSGHVHDAGQLVERVRAQLQDMTGSNLLLTLLNDLYEKLQSAGEDDRDSISRHRQLRGMRS